MKKLITLFLMSLIFNFVKAGLTDTLYIDTYGRFYIFTLNKNSGTKAIQYGGGNAYSDQLVIYTTLTDTTNYLLYCNNCGWSNSGYQNVFKSTLTFFNNIRITSVTNLKLLLGTIFTAANSGGGGGGGGSFTSLAGNIVTNLGGGNYVANQLQTDWNALSGVSSILNKPNIPIVDTNLLVKLRDSNKFKQGGYITPFFFNANQNTGFAITKWGNLNISGYQVQKLNDSFYIITRDNTIINDSIRINNLTNRFVFDSSNKIALLNNKMDINRFISDSIKYDSAIQNRVIGGSIDTINRILTLTKTNNNNIVLQFNRLASSSSITKWGNLSINGYQVQKLNDSMYLINRDNTIINDSIRINNLLIRYMQDSSNKLALLNTKLDITRFVNDSIKYDSAIQNRVIAMNIDTGTNIFTYYKTNGSIVSLQFKQMGGSIGTGNISGNGIIGSFPIFIGTQIIQYSPFRYYTTAQGEKGISFTNFFKIDSGLTNTSLGYGTLVNTTFGGGNTALGYSALNNNTTGTKNTAVGSDVLLANTSGSFNTGVGYYALSNITTGKGNIVLGGNNYRTETDTQSNTLAIVTTDATGNNSVKIKSNQSGVMAFPQGYQGRGRRIAGIDNLGNIIDTNNNTQDTAIANRIIDMSVDTNTNRLTLYKPNGNNKILQLKLAGGGSAISINNDSFVHPYPYPYKDTVNIISTTDKVVNLGTNNKALINFNESIKVTQLFSTLTNINNNARVGKFIRYNNTFQIYQNNQLLSANDGMNFTQYTTSQIISGNNSYTTIEAMDLTGDSLVVLTSEGGGNYILCILGSTGTTILYRSTSFTIQDGSGSFVTDISKIQLLGTSLYAVNGNAFNNYLIKINITNLSSQIITTIGTPASFFKSATNLYYLDYSGWYYEINAPNTRILKISNNAVTDATILQNRYICVSDYAGNIFVADITTNKVVDYITELYFGSSDISVFAFGNILYLLEGTATNYYVTAYQFSTDNLVVNSLSPFRFNSSLLDSSGNSGIAGQSLLSQNGKAVWGTPIQTYPQVSILIWNSTATGSAQNPQLSFQSNANDIGLVITGTGVTLPPGTYQINVIAGMPSIDNNTPYVISFFKFGTSSTIDAIFPTFNEIRGSLTKANTITGLSDVLNGTFSNTIKITNSTVYYITTYINRAVSAAMSGFINIVRIK